MKKLKVFLMTFMLSTTVFMTTDIYSQDNSPAVSTESSVEVAQPTQVDKVKVVFAAVEKDAAKVVLPELNPELGFFEQAVILVQFGVKNWKSLGGLGISSLILLLLISLLSSPLSKGWFGKKSKKIKRLVIAVLGQAVGITAGIYGGAVWYVAIVTGLITSMGAVTIFEAAKPLFAKKG